MITRKVVVAAVLLIFLVIGVPFIFKGHIGCVIDPSTGITNYIKKNKYEPLIPPRSSDGAGTIIEIIDGKETIIATPEECLDPNKVPPATINISILSGYIKSSQKDALVFEIPKLTKEFDLTFI